jgi:poly-beta-1,6-N-acetyl-D-glucosamine N-deacetylase
MKNFLRSVKDKDRKTSLPAFTFPRHLPVDKNWVKSFVFHFLCRSKAVGIWQFLFQRSRPSIALYHDPNPAVFAAHIDELKKHFNIISLRDYITARRDNTVDRLPKYALIITIDDGWAGNYKLLDVIAQKGVPVTIFLASGVTNTYRHFWWTYITSDDDFRRMKKERHAEVADELRRVGYHKEAAYSTRQVLCASEIREMARYVDFQAHTRFHPVLPICTDEEAYDEIVGCKTELAQHFSLDIYALSYPHGAYCDRDVALARQAGYRCALTVEAGLNTKSSDPFHLKRIYLPDDARPMEVVVKASGLWAGLTRP